MDADDFVKKSARCHHLAKQLTEASDDLFDSMAEATKESIRNKDSNVDHIIDFDLIKNIMRTSAKLDLLSDRFYRVYITSAALAGTKDKKFLDKINQDIKNPYDANFCDCDECALLQQEAVGLANDIVKKVLENKDDKDNQ